MFAKKHTSMFGAFAIDSKASRGRHARVKGCARSTRHAIQGQPGQVQAFAGECVSRPLSFDEGEFLVDGYGAYAPYDRATERYAAKDLLLGEGSNETADDASSHEKVSSAQLDGMFQEFFRMGAAVAIGELYGEGMLGDKNAVAYDVRDYLESFGIASFDEVCRLGITGPYLEGFKRIFAANASFPPAA